MGLFKKDKYKKIDNVPELPPIQQVYPQSQTSYIRQPIQMGQQFNQARIISIEESEEGEFIYKVVTNYQLNLGYCNLTNI